MDHLGLGAIDGLAARVYIYTQPSGGQKQELEVEENSMVCSAASCVSVPLSLRSRLTR